MKKINLLLILIFLAVQIFPGCSNPVDNTVTVSYEAGSEVDLTNSAIEFYVWKYVHHGMSPAVPKAFIEIYQGSTLILSTGVTRANGRFYIPAASLPQGNYTVYAFTLIGNHIDYYGWSNFYNSNSYNLVSIQVNHI